MRASGLRFKEFVIKYATLNRCDEKTLSDIIYFLISSSSHSEDPLTQEEYARFVREERECFGFEPSYCSQKFITRGEFYESLNSSGFFWDDYRKRFSLINRKDMPFETISKELLDLELSDLDLGEKYYVVSSSWFERWSFYYQGKDHTIHQEEIKSTKLLRKNSKISNSGRGSSYELLKKKRRSLSLSLNGADEDIWLI